MIFFCICLCIGRVSKFRHLKGTPLHKSLHIENIRNVSRQISGECDGFHGNYLLKYSVAYRYFKVASNPLRNVLKSCYGALYKLYMIELNALVSS
jgi:hypothetical protein